MSKSTIPAPTPGARRVVWRRHDASIPRRFCRIEDIVLVAGGVSQEVLYVPASQVVAELYDPVSDSWTSAETTGGSVAALLPTGRVLFVGHNTTQFVTDRESFTSGRESAPGAAG